MTGVRTRPGLRFAAALVGALLCALAACDALLVDPAPPPPATLTATVALAPGTAERVGSTGEAFDKVDQVRVRLLEGTTVVHDETVAFRSTGGDTPLAPIAVTAAGSSATVRVEIEMLWQGQPMFSGSATATLVSGASTDVSVSLEAIASGIVVDAVAPIEALGDTRQMSGAVTFASGDEIPSGVLSWSSQTPSVASVTTGGLLTALGEGTATVVASHAGLSETVAVVVAAVVTSVVVEPESGRIVLGGTAQFQASVLDRNGNLLQRAPDWSTEDPSVATVDANGLATARGIGTTAVTAEAGGVEGSASLTVSADPPEVTTQPASSVTTTDATLRGTVNPSGLATVAWFEWGPENDPGSFDETPERDAGTGFTASDVDEALSGLTPGSTYYFRVAARNSIGTSRGEILEFSTEPLLRILTTSLPAGVPGFSYSVQLVATGGDGTYTWGLAGGALPPGYDVTASGILAGTTNSTGTFQFTVQVASGTQTETADLSLTIVEQLAIVTEKLPNGVVGASYNAPLDAQGGTGAYSWSHTGGTLPPGLRVETNGVVTGVPTQAGSFSFTVGVTSGPQTATRDMTIFVTQPSARLTGTVSYAGSPQAGVPVTLTGPSNRSTVTNGAGQYAFTALPEGTYTATIQPDFSEAQFGPLKKTVFVPDGAAVILNFGGDGPPDLTVPSGISASPTTVFVGQQVTLSSWTVRNSGNGPSGGFANRFYISTNSILSNADTPLGNNSNSSLAPGQQFTWGGPTLTIPNNLSSGTYWIGVLVDWNNGAAESNEFNNYASTPINVLVPPSAPPGGAESR